MKYVKENGLYIPDYSAKNLYSIAPGIMPIVGGPSGPVPPLTNLEMWLKTPIVGLVNDDPVDTWPDSSGNGIDANGNTALTIYKTNILDGFAAVRCVKSAIGNPFIASLNAAIDSWTEASVYCVLKAALDPGAGDGTGTALWAITNNSLSTHYVFSDGNFYDSTFSTVRKNTGNPTLNVASAFRLLCITSIDNDWNAFIDGTLHFNTATNTFDPPDTILLGQGGSAGGLFGCDADIVEFMIFSEAHDTTQRQDVEAYFAVRFPTLGL